MQPGCGTNPYFYFMRSQIHMNFASDLVSLGVNGMDSSSLLQGRPYEGCAIIIRKSLLGNVTMLKCNSNQFCGVRLLDQSGQSILLVCVYFPTDYHTSTSIDELNHTLGELEGFIDSQSFDHLIIAGDFNVDFDRPDSSLAQLCNFKDLAAVDLQYRSPVNFKDDHSARSWVDHFLCNHSCLTN